jgi:acetylornithine/succinyldiaminopimelate/putrescine aminotransferase
VALAALRFIAQRREELLSQVNAMSSFFAERLQQMNVEDVSIAGLAIGVALGGEDRVQQVREKCRRDGLLVTGEGGKLLLLPALNIDRKTAARGLDTLQRSL